jgi:hypothetical protein
LKAHILAGVTKDCDKAERLQSEALKICEWGAKKWANVDFEDKGVIFRPSFIVGLKSMRLETYRQVRRVQARFQRASFSRTLISYCRVSQFKWDGPEDPAGSHSGSFTNCPWSSKKSQLPKSKP